MITIAYHADLDEVQGEARAGAPTALSWAELCTSPAQAAPFDRIEWWRGLAEDCGLAPLIAVAQEGEAVALLPLMHGHGRLEALANWYSFRWRPIVSPGADAPALLTALARDLATRTSRITLAPLPDVTPLTDDGGETRLLAAAFRAAGWVVEPAEVGINHVLPVAGRSFAAYLAGRPGPLRTTLARKGHKVDIQILRHFDAAAWDAYEAIYRASWKPAEGSAAFLRHFAEAEGQAGRLRLGIARADGQPVAAQLWNVEGATAFIHKLSHTEAAKALSPGTTLTAALLEHVIDRDRVTLVNFGIGDEPYKRDWMEAARPLWRLDMFRPERPACWPHIARAVFRRLAGGAPRV